MKKNRLLWKSLIAIAPLSALVAFTASCNESKPETPGKEQNPSDSNKDKDAKARLENQKNLIKQLLNQAETALKAESTSFGFGEAIKRVQKLQKDNNIIDATFATRLDAIVKYNVYVELHNYLKDFKENFSSKTDENIIEYKSKAKADLTKFTNNQKVKLEAFLYVINAKVVQRNQDKLFAKISSIIKGVPTDPTIAKEQLKSLPKDFSKLNSDQTEKIKDTYKAYLFSLSDFVNQPLLEAEIDKIKNLTQTQIDVAQPRKVFEDAINTLTNPSLNHVFELSSIVLQKLNTRLTTQSLNTLYPLYNNIIKANWGLTSKIKKLSDAMISIDVNQLDRVGLFEFSLYANVLMKYKIKYSKSLDSANYIALKSTDELAKLVSTVDKTSFNKKSDVSFIKVLTFKEANPTLSPQIYALRNESNSKVFVLWGTEDARTVLSKTQILGPNTNAILNILHGERLNYSNSLSYTQVFDNFMSIKTRIDNMKNDINLAFGKAKTFVNVAKIDVKNNALQIIGSYEQGIKDKNPLFTIDDIAIFIDDAQTKPFTYDKSKFKLEITSVTESKVLIGAVDILVKISYVKEPKIFLNWTLTMNKIAGVFDETKAKAFIEIEKAKNITISKINSAIPLYVNPNTLTKFIQANITENNNTVIYEIPENEYGIQFSAYVSSIVDDQNVKVTLSWYYKTTPTGSNIRVTKELDVPFDVKSIRDQINQAVIDKSNNYVTELENLIKEPTTSKGTLLSKYNTAYYFIRYKLKDIDKTLWETLLQRLATVKTTIDSWPATN